MRTFFDSCKKLVMCCVKFIYTKNTTTNAYVIYVCVCVCVSAYWDRREQLVEEYVSLWVCAHDVCRWSDEDGWKQCGDLFWNDLNTYKHIYCIDNTSLMFYFMHTSMICELIAFPIQKILHDEIKWKYMINIRNLNKLILFLLILCLYIEIAG